MQTNSLNNKQPVEQILAASRPIIISGPCSAESEEQVVTTATQLAATGKVNIFRAGIWKPRTKPGMFEGAGTKALEWINTAKKITGIPLIVEVAKAKHVEDALKASIDYLWIGARTTANPFSVQEVADALKGVTIPVFVKNPIHPDIELWSGGIERLQDAGIKQIGMIHRGFSGYANKGYRNIPMWHLPIEMKRRFPNMPMLCDPSHIGGSRDKLQSISQKSIDLDFDGLMIETHYEPDNALSDSKQQVTPATLATILSKLIWRNVNTDDEEFWYHVSTLREQINHIDNELLLLLAQRMKAAEKIGEHKKETNITIFQKERWSEIIDSCLAKGEQLGLSKEFLKKYLEAVHIESINHQNKIMNEKQG